TGSFFTNPIVPVSVADTLPANAPRFAHHEAPDAPETVKLSAAWLIDHAGYHKGFGLHDEPGTVNGRAALSTKHTLALTNRGSATTQDLIQIATLVRDGVAEKWGITLVPEPVLVGVQLGSYRTRSSGAFHPALWFIANSSSVERLVTYCRPAGTAFHAKIAYLTWGYDLRHVW